MLTPYLCKYVKYFSRGIVHHQNENYFYQYNKALAHVKPLPKAARQTKSPSRSNPFSQISHRAIGIEAAVVLPYFWILLWTWSSRNPSFFCTYWLIRRFAW